MRITNSKLAYTIGALLLTSLTTAHAQAVSVTDTGTFTTDADVATEAFTLTTAQTVDIFTTSYAGGMNLDGTTSMAGGFLPSVTLFSVATGSVVDYGAAGVTGSGMPMGPVKTDPTTGLANDVYLIENLAAGSYVADLTEVPNVAINGINDGFLFSGDPTITGDSCSVPGGMFLETDTAPCAQRNANYSLNIGTATPEPATFWLALPVCALGIIFRKRLAHAFGQQA